MKPTEHTYIRDKNGTIFLRLGMIKDVLTTEETIEYFGKHHRMDECVFKRVKPNYLPEFCHGAAILSGDVILTPDEVEALKIELL